MMDREKANHRPTPPSALTRVETEIRMHRFLLAKDCSAAADIVAGLLMEGPL